MMRRILATLFVSGAWLACVGDDPIAVAPDAKTGDRLGPCFDDGKCKEGLVCHPTEKVCVAANDTAPDASGDASTSDPEADASDADADVPQCMLRPTAGIPCPDVACSAPLNRCCIDGAGKKSCSGSCSAGGSRYFECDSVQVCGAGTRCCAAIEQSAVGTTCKTRFTLEYSVCIAQDCPQSVATCRTASDCDLPGMGKCNLSEVVLAPGVVSVWGFCGP